MTDILINQETPRTCWRHAGVLFWAPFWFLGSVDEKFLLRRDYVVSYRAPKNVELEFRPVQPNARRHHICF
jgi:hypothetical protein